MRYSGLAVSFTAVIGTFCGELSLGTDELTAILNDALVAPDSIVALAISASFISTASALVVNDCIFIPSAAAGAFSRMDLAA